MNNPFFSIIIATHKRSNLLERSIQSVVNQSYKLNNFIVVSDIDDLDSFLVSNNLLRSGDLFIQRSGVLGPAESRNLALDLAKGTHVIFLDDDDAFRPDFLTNLTENISIGNTNKIYYVNSELIDFSTNLEAHTIDFCNHSVENLWVKNFLPNNSIIYPASIAKKIKFENDIAYEDWDYLLSAMNLCELEYIPILGPIIFKNSDINSKPRGESNNNKLIECYAKIYKRHPSINTLIANKRKELFDSIGINLDTILVNIQQ
jgi:glycosyltransferase involved in cell wall biosynthesis